MRRGAPDPQLSAAIAAHEEPTAATQRNRVVRAAESLPAVDSKLELIESLHLRSAQCENREARIANQALGSIRRAHLLGGHDDSAVMAGLQEQNTATIRRGMLRRSPRLGSCRALCVAQSVNEAILSTGNNHCGGDADLHVSVVRHEMRTFKMRK